MPTKLRIGVALVCAALWLPAAGAFGADEKMPSQVTKAEIVHVVAEVTAIDQASRELTLTGPLGGEIDVQAGPEVKNLGQVKVGDLVEITYYESMAVSAHKKGDPNPLFTGGDTSTAAAGEAPAAQTSRQKHEVVKVFSVDVEKRLLVVENAAGHLISHEVERPEFVQKLAGLQPGDELDVVTTAGVAISVTPAKEGSAPSAVHAVGTLIVDRGEVMRRVGNTLMIKNERGRMVKVTVDGSFKFKIRGEDKTVYDLQPGMRLERMAFRVTDVEYVGTP